MEWDTKNESILDYLKRQKLSKAKAGRNIHHLVEKSTVGAQNNKPTETIYLEIAISWKHI